LLSNALFILRGATSNLGMLGLLLLLGASHVLRSTRYS